MRGSGKWLINLEVERSRGSSILIFWLGFPFSPDIKTKSPDSKNESSTEAKVEKLPSNIRTLNPIGITSAIKVPEPVNLALLTLDSKDHDISSNPARRMDPWNI